MIELVTELKQAFLNHKSKRPFLVALDGLAGAGKTTLMKRLVEQMDSVHQVSVIHIDDYIETENKRYQTGFEQWYEYYQLQWDVQKLIEDLFQPLREESIHISLDTYNKKTDAHKRTWLTVEPNSIVFIEGIFLQRKEWRHYYDYVIYLDCPRDIRYARISNREGLDSENQLRLEKYKTRYWPGEDYYLKTERPLEQATKIFSYKQ